MPRAKGGFKTRRRRKGILERSKGFYGSKSRLFRPATEAVDKALQYAYRDRKVKKREFRALWIIRINAGVRQLGLTYSKFMLGLKLAKIELDRRVLADMAFHNPVAFKELTDTVKAQLAA